MVINLWLNNKIRIKSDQWGSWKSAWRNSDCQMRTETNMKDSECLAVFCPQIYGKKILRHKDYL